MMDRGYVLLFISKDVDFGVAGVIIRKHLRKAGISCIFLQSVFIVVVVQRSVRGIR